jgi:hypothetical protein
MTAKITNNINNNKIITITITTHTLEKRAIEV